MNPLHKLRLLIDLRRTRRPSRRLRPSSEGLESRQLLASGDIVAKAVVPLMDAGREYSSAKAILARPDGKLLVAAFANDADGNNALTVALVGADLARDRSVAPARLMVTFPGQVGSYAGVSAMAFAPGGKIALAGWAQDNHGQQYAVIARLNADLTPDLSFGPGGVRVHEWSYHFGATLPNDTNHAVAVQGDGKIVVAATASNQWYDSDIVVARYNVDGTLDSSFGSGGWVYLSGPVASGDSSDFASSIVLLPDGRIRVGGTTSGGGATGLIVAGLLADGRPETSFGHNGVARVDFDGGVSATGMVLDESGRLVLVGTTYGGDVDIAVARLLADGTLDSSFDGDGRLTLAVDADGKLGRDDGNAILSLPGGDLIVVGRTEASGKVEMVAIRLKADGSRDAQFHRGEPVRVASPRAGDSYAEAWAVAPGPNGSAILAGRTIPPDFSDSLIALVEIEGNTPVPTPEPVPLPLPEPDPLPLPEPDPVPTPEPVPLPIPTPVPTPEPDPLPLPEPDPLPLPEPDPVPTPEPVPLPIPTPVPTPEPDPLPLPEPPAAEVVHLIGVRPGPERDALHTLILSFDGPLSPEDAQNPGNYRLAHPGHDLKFDTKDDRLQAIASAAYNASRHEVTLTLSRGYIATAALQLTVKAGVTADDGTPVEGTASGLKRLVTPTWVPPSVTVAPASASPSSVRHKATFRSHRRSR